MVMVLSGCAKEMIPGLVQGKYTVSGVLYNWSVYEGMDTTYYNNVTLEVDNVDKETISVYISGIQPLYEITYDENASSGDYHVFNGGPWCTYSYAFKKKNLRKVEIDILCPIGNAKVRHYILTGTKK